MMFRSVFLLALVLVALVGSTGGALAGGRNPEGPREPLGVERGGSSYAFEVEVVRREADRNRGLMFRESMDAAHGMLFDFDPPRPVSFWMKNTHIPLDIIFIDADGLIIRIAENTVPFSLDPIPSGGSTRGVLEINAGLSRKLGLRPGDRVRHRIFGNTREVR